MKAEEILHQRLLNQGLTTKHFKSAAEAVETLGAVQAQDFPNSKWGLGLRLKGADNAELDKVYNAGKILRTHVMRPTWHFVSPKDIRWMQMLTGPRVKRVLESYNRRLGLTEKVFVKGRKIIEKELKGNNYLTRQELASALKKDGFILDVQKLAHIVAWAELESLVCSGPLKGKKFSYALVEERVPKAKELTREEALRELVLRYFTSHGPATVKDFTWWSGLNAEECKQGIELNKTKLKSFDFGEQLFYFSPKQKKIKEFDAALYLLPNYDEYTIGYTSKHALYLPKNHSIFSGTGFYHTIVKQGMVIGTWKRVTSSKHYTIRSKPLTPLTQKDKQSLQIAAEKYGEFFGMGIKLF